MAKIEGGGVFGEMSGKLGSVVFASNKSGAYARQYVKATNPNTTAQAQNRTRFGACASTWKSIGVGPRSQWDTFARDIYVPKHGTNVGQFSGVNAMTACANVVSNVSSKLKTITFSVNGSGVTPLPTPVAPVFTALPPSKYCPAGFIVPGSDESPAFVKEVTAQVLWPGTGYIEIEMEEGSTGYRDLLWAPGTEPKRSLVVYMSNGNPYPGGIYQNEEKHILMATPFLNFAGSDLLAVEKMRFTWAAGPNLALYNSWPNPGQYVRLSCYWYDALHGTLTRFGVVDDVQLGF